MNKENNPFLGQTNSNIPPAPPAPPSFTPSAPPNYQNVSTQPQIRPQQTPPQQAQTRYAEPPSQQQGQYDLATTVQSEVVNAELVTDQDLDVLKNQLTQQVKMSPRVAQLANEIQVGKPQTILDFGQGAAEGISRYADSILSQTSSVAVNDRGTMLKDLSKIMKNFDLEDFTKEPKKPSFLQKLTGKAQNQIEKILAKYKTMDGDIQNIYVQLKEYESEIKRSNLQMDEMTKGVMQYYVDLETHIQAGNYIKEVAQTQWLPAIETEVANNPGDMMLPQSLSDANDFVELIDQRIQDLQMAQFVALQTLPQIKMSQKGNNLLMRKINSAFVVTLPIFKLGLSQAITAKRQRIQVEAMQALDETTNQMLVQSAQNNVANAKFITQVAGGASVKMETLQETFNTIVNGISEVQQIEEDNKREREQNRGQLEQLKRDLKSKNF